MADAVARRVLLAATAQGLAAGRRIPAARGGPNRPRELDGVGRRRHGPVLSGTARAARADARGGLRPGGRRDDERDRSGCRFAERRVWLRERGRPRGGRRGARAAARPGGSGRCPTLFMHIAPGRRDDGPLGRRGGGVRRGACDWRAETGQTTELAMSLGGLSMCRRGGRSAGAAGDGRGRPRRSSRRNQVASGQLGWRSRCGDRLPVAAEVEAAVGHYARLDVLLGEHRVRGPGPVCRPRAGRGAGAARSTSTRRARSRRRASPALCQGTAVVAGPRRTRAGRCPPTRARGPLRRGTGAARADAGRLRARPHPARLRRRPAS